MSDFPVLRVYLGVKSCPAYCTSGGNVTDSSDFPIQALFCVAGVHVFPLFSAVFRCFLVFSRVSCFSDLSALDEDFWPHWPILTLLADIDHFWPVLAPFGHY